MAPAAQEHPPQRPHLHPPRRSTAGRCCKAACAGDPAAALGSLCPVWPVLLCRRVGVFAAQVPSPSRLNTAHFPVRPPQPFLSLLGPALSWGHCWGGGGPQVEIGRVCVCVYVPLGPAADGRGDRGGCSRLSGLLGAFIHHSFIQHTFTEQLLCAKPCSRTWGFRCEQNKDPHGSSSVAW